MTHLNRKTYFKLILYSQIPEIGRLDFPIPVCFIVGISQIFMFVFGKYVYSFLSVNVIRKILKLEPNLWNREIAERKLVLLNSLFDTTKLG